jgi:hypothetical protein
MSFKDGRIGVGKDPIFPLDISGSCRIDGDLILGGRFSDSQGNPIQLGSGSGATSTPQQTQDSVPSWSSSSLKTSFSGNVGIGTTSPKSKLHIKGGHLLISEGTNSYNNSGGCIQFHSRENISNSDGTIWGQDYAHSLIADVKYGSGQTIPSNDKSEMMFYKGNNATGDYGPDRFHFIGKADFRITLGASPDATGKHGHEAARLHSSWADGQDATFIVKYNGNVGIGTTSPGCILEVYDNSPLEHVQDIVHVKNSGGYDMVTLGTSAWFNSGSLALYKNSSGLGGDRTIYLDGSTAGVCYLNAGNVGIGTTSPGAKLHLGSGAIRIDHTSTSYLTIDHNQVYKTGGDLYLNWNTQNNVIICGQGGKVAIGTSSPQTMLDVRGEGGGSSGGNCLALRNGNNATNYESSQILFSWSGYPYTDGYSHKIQSRHQSGTTHNQNAIDFYLWKNGQGSGDIGNTHGMSITAGGVGIGTSSPHSSYKLDVNGSIRTTSGGFISTESHPASPKQWTIVRYFQNSISNGGFCAIKDERNNGNSPWGDGASFAIGEKRQGNYYIGVQLRGYTCYANTSSLGNVNISDRRIKKDIEDVPDNYALQKVRDLPCRYYNYKHEPKNSEHKVVGFIAQEVKQHLPGCINEGEMPVCMPNICEFVNVTWEKIGIEERDPSKNIFKIKSSEFEEYSNLTHRFYFSNDGSKNDENVLIRESSKEEDNSFVITEIDEPYDYVYVYGASQSDFLTIKKDQIFALHHSAIQELDRKVITLEEKIETKEKIETNQEKIETLTKENQEQNVKILDLYKENNILKARLEKIQAYLGI